MTGTSIRMTRGKADFIKRVMPCSGKTIDICLLEWNVDLSRGCMAQVFSEHYEETMQNNGLYSKGNFAKYKLDGTADGRCDYCYAWGKNSGSILPYVVDEKTRSDFETIRPKFLRFGKNSEPGHPYYFKPFFDLISLCKEFGTTPIITTKMLPFGLEGALETQKYSSSNSDVIARYAQENGYPSGEQIAKMLRESKTSLLMSLGYDSIELGPLSQGFSNQWRIEQAKKFHSSGVNTSLTVVCDTTSSIGENVSRGSFIGEALKAKADTGINVRIIPCRFYTHKSAVVIAGSRRKVLNDSGYHGTYPLPGVEEKDPIGMARYRASGMLKTVANYFHPEFEKLNAEGMGFCGATGEKEHCDKCNTLGKTRISFPVSQLPKIEFTNLSRRQEQSNRFKNKKHKGTPLLSGLKSELKKSI